MSRCVIISGSPDCTFFPALRPDDYVIATNETRTVREFVQEDSI